MLCPTLITVQYKVASGYAQFVYMDHGACNTACSSDPVKIRKSMSMDCMIKIRNKDRWGRVFEDRKEFAALSVPHFLTQIF